MNRLIAWFNLIIKKQKKLKRWQRVVTVLAAIITFVTTYALILPAITVEKEALEDVGGMYLETAEDPAVKQDEGLDEALVPVSVQIAADQDDAVSFLYEDEEMSAVATFSTEEEIPEGAGLVVNYVDPESEMYAEFGGRAAALLAQESVNEVKTCAFYDFALVCDGVDVTPESGLADIRIYYFNNTVEHFEDVIYGGKFGLKNEIEETVSDPAEEEDGLLMVSAELDEESIGQEEDTAPVPENNTDIFPGDELFIENVDETAVVELADGIITTLSVKGLDLAENDSVVGLFAATVEQDVTDIDDNTDVKQDVTDTVNHTEEASLEETTPAEGPCVLTAEGPDYSVKVNCNVDSGVPKDAILEVSEIKEGSKSYKRYLEEAKKAMGFTEEEKLPQIAARFFDIKIMVNGEEFTPESGVTVEIAYAENLADDKDAEVNALHFAEGTSKPDVLDANVTEVSEDGTTNVEFTAESFSVYGVVYTVDFHYTANGKTYNFSIPGGGYITLQQLVEVLGIAEDDEHSAGIMSFIEEAIANLEGDSASEEIKEFTLSSVQISRKTKDFVADMENVEFSSPELAWVGKAEKTTTVGTLKETNGLECQYSDTLTEEEIAEINKSTINAGDWALISLKPFISEETLTITMKNGDQFVIQVTDAQLADDLDGKAFVIKTQDNNYAMSPTSVDWEGNQHFLRAESPSGEDEQIWIFEYVDAGYGNTYRIKSATTGLYLKTSNNNYSNGGNYSASLVDSNSSPTLYYIDYTNGSYSITTYHNSGYRYLSFDDSYNTPRFYFGNNEQRFTFEEILPVEEPDPADRVGDWLLYLDDDFDEITIHVGETITLRPYDKWDWEDGRNVTITEHIGWFHIDHNYTVQDQKYWNVGTWTDWSMTKVGDDIPNGQDTVQDNNVDSQGIFKWTRYVKKDDQLETFYWSVQGVATEVGDYTLTNTEGKTITVHVIPGTPVSTPHTVDKIANIKVNLFDYDNGGKLDVGLVNGEKNHNLANDSNFKNESVNQMGGSNHFYFLSSGSGNNNSETWNSYSQGNPNLQIVKDTLGEDGYPVLSHVNNNDKSLKYLFDTSQTSWQGGGGNGMIAYPDVVGMFQKDSKGYYYFNSNTNYFYYDTKTGTPYLYAHTYTQTSGEEKGSLVNDKPIGFFPFHEYDSTSNLYVNQNDNLNHHIGMSMEVEFMLSRDKKDDNGRDVTFDFSGDDDLWVFVEWEDDYGVKHSQLLLDLGGIHQPIQGSINFTDLDLIEPLKPYTLKVFYLERGGCDSNCSIRFNLPIIQELVVAKKLTGLTEAEKVKYKNEEFTYELKVNGELYTYPNPERKYEKAVIRNAAGEDITPDNFTIVNGQVTLKDGEYITISYLDKTDYFTVAEENTPNMENFEVPNAERYYHLPQDASLYEEEITLSEAQTEGTTPSVKEWITPQYDLEETEKITFTNTLQEKNLEVEKKWDDEEDTHPAITFTVSATVDDGTGGREAIEVEELKNPNGKAKVFTLDEDNDWRYAIEHLPVNTPDGKFIFYDIVEGQVDGYVLTGSTDLTAEEYNYCNIDVVKLWPDSNGDHTEILYIVLQNSEGEYYAGDDDDGEPIFVDDITLAEVRELKPGNNYSQRFNRLPYGDYTAVQLHQDDYNHGLSTYRRSIIQYELENTPLENPVDPEDLPNDPVIHKRIDALRDGVENPDSAHADEDLTDLYRLYLDYKINSLQEPDGVDLLFIIDHSGSMNDSHWPGNEYRAPAVMAALNGEDGFISEFLAANENNQWAAVGFTGPDGFRDYEFSLLNPWQPNTELSQQNAGQNGSEVLSPGGTSYEFTTDSANIDLSGDRPLNQSNYTAGFWRAEQFLLNPEVMEDEQKKVIVFITDGVPTLHIDDLNGSLEGAGTAAGSPYYREEYGGCPDEALTEFGYFVNDLNDNDYVFGGDDGNIEFYTIGLGAQMQTADNASFLNDMLDAAYGENDHSDHYMTISDTAIPEDDEEIADYSAATNKLINDLRTVLGMNDTFSNLVIQDDLSKYVDLFGLSEEVTGTSAIMTAAKAKVTMTIPNPDDPDNPEIVTLYENGQPVSDATFTKKVGETETEATIIKELQYDASTKTVKVIFDPEYHPTSEVTYTLSFDVKATDEAYTTYAESGYDKYTSGDNEGQIIKGDEDTDFLGTDPANATSVDKEGFRSNDQAKATYTHNGEDEEVEYLHPVIQVAAYADIVKVDETGKALEGAKFNLYDGNYDESKTMAENADCLIKADYLSKKPTDPPGDDAIIRSGKLAEGTYYLVETKSPDGYDPLPGPVKITVTDTNGTLSMVASIADVPVGADKLIKVKNGVWKLSVLNSSGYELPHTGGFGTNIIYLLGLMLIAFAGTGLIISTKKRRAA